MSDLHADHYCYDTSGITKMDRQIDEFFRLSEIKINTLYYINKHK